MVRGHLGRVSPNISSVGEINGFGCRAGRRRSPDRPRATPRPPSRTHRGMSPLRWTCTHPLGHASREPRRRPIDVRFGIRLGEGGKVISDTCMERLPPSVAPSLQRGARARAGVRFDLHIRFPLPHRFMSAHNDEYVAIYKYICPLNNRIEGGTSPLSPHFHGFRNEFVRTLRRPSACTVCGVGGRPPAHGILIGGADAFALSLLAASADHWPPRPRYHRRNRQRACAGGRRETWGRAHTSQDLPLPGDG